MLRMVLEAKQGGPGLLIWMCNRVIHNPSSTKIKDGVTFGFQFCSWQIVTNKGRRSWIEKIETKTSKLQQ